MKKAVYAFPLGHMHLEYHDDVVYSLNIYAEKAAGFTDDCPFSKKVFQELAEYFAGKRTLFSIICNPQGTEFQKQVWKALCDIPYGQTRSYKDIAKAIGNEKACRAVGMANNKNPISIIIPCHRVIGSNGKMVGYGAGVDKKIYLLRLESDQHNLQL